MTSPRSDDLQNGIDLLRKALKEGKFHVAPHLAEAFEASFSRVRVDETGRVDPSTVDSQIRMAAKALLWRHEREEAKQAAPLEDIQAAYFERVSSTFGEIEQLRAEHGASPYQIARAIAGDASSLHENHKVAQQFMEEIREFWDNVSYPAWIHAEEDRALKAVFTGELFPDGRRNAASLYGFYVDSILLPDPFLKLTPLLGIWSKEKQVYEVIRLALQVLQYRELALENVFPPIVAILPDRFGLRQDYREFIAEAAAPDAIRHASLLFGREFSSADDVTEYVTPLQTPADVENAVRRPDLLMFDTRWGLLAAEQLQNYFTSDLLIPGVDGAGLHVWTHILSRMSQATDALRRATEAGGTPVMHAPTSWRWFNWKLEYGSDAVGAGSSVHAHVVQALQGAGAPEGNFEWIGEIPPASLIEMRREGAVKEIRELLSAGVAELSAAAPTNFISTSNLVVANLRLAFADHQRAIRSAKAKKWKFAGRDVASFLVAGGIEVAAAASGKPLFGVGAALVTLSGLSPTVKEVLGRFANSKREHESLLRSPVGLLFAPKPKPR